MLVPLTREKFEQVIPRIATGPQYKYYWGNFSDFLQRLLISVVSVSAVLLIKSLLGLDFGLIFLVGLIGAFYWLWGPILWAGLRNYKCRGYKYGGFFRGRILDVWLTDEVKGKQETVNNKGELVIVENREKIINIEVGDESGFETSIQAPLRNEYKGINTGQKVEMVVMSNRPDLSEIEEISDIYIPSRNMWVGNYPFLSREFFTEVSKRIRDGYDEDRPQRRRGRESEQKQRYYQDDRDDTYDRDDRYDRDNRYDRYDRDDRYDRYDKRNKSNRYEEDYDY
jgi:hypothetical protein